MKVVGQKQKRGAQLEMSEMDPARAEDAGQLKSIRWQLHCEK